MEYSDEFLSKIMQVGTLGYPLSKILNVLDIEDPKTFIKDFDNPDSRVAKYYVKGIDKADFMMDISLFNKAKSGDLIAFEKYFVRKKNQLEIANDEEYERKYGENNLNP